MISVIHYLRKRRPNANFSLEFIFEDVRERLDGGCIIETRIAPKISSGVSGRLSILWDVFKLKKHNLHITGDINFATLGAKKNRTILTLLDCGFVHRSKGLQRWLLKKLWLDWPVAWAARVTTISQSAKSEIVELTGCSPEKVVVIPVAISEAFAPVEQVFNSTKPRILHIGTAPNKNLVRHIQALKGLDCTLVIIGVIDESYKALLSNCQISYENYVALDSQEVVSQYERCDMVCFASTHEGFGMPILEAQAVGRPVITSNISSMPEVAGDGALLVNPLDIDEIRAAVIKVINDVSLRSELVSRGFENVKRFNGQTIADQYLRLYEEVWGPSKRT